MHATRRALALGRSLFLLVSGVLLASGLPAGSASAGIGFPCTLGHASPTGFQPCTPCEPGTFAPGFGATSCDPCPDRTAATGSGAFVCTNCICDDDTACTHDSCEPDTGVCTAEPVAACEEVHLEFTGVVEAVSDPLSLVEVGMPVAGSYDVDPLAPDEQPDNPDLGRYRSALRSLEFRVGDPAVFVATSRATFPVGRADMWLDPDEIYSALIDITVTTPTDVHADIFSLSLSGADPLDDDSLVVAPELASFDTYELQILRFEFPPPPLPGPFLNPIIESSVVTLTAPEPAGAAVACAAAAALIALARIRSRRGASET